MKNNLYTVDQVADIIGLHPKTVRRFIQEGKLKAGKIGGQWRISQNDLDQVMGNSSILEATGEVHSKDTFESSEDYGEKPAVKAQASTVVDINVKDADEAMRISNTIIAVMNSKDPKYGYARFDHVYYKNEGKARYILWGQPEFIGNMLLTISEIIK